MFQHFTINIGIKITATVTSGDSSPVTGASVTYGDTINNAHTNNKNHEPTNADNTEKLKIIEQADNSQGIHIFPKIKKYYIYINIIIMTNLTY